MNLSTEDHLEPGEKEPASSKARMMSINRPDNSGLTIHQLSFELIAYVFEFYVDNPKGALPLGAVCRAWRHITWTTPTLWTELTFVLKPNTTERQIVLAIEWLNRSGALPLSITLHAQPSSVETQILVIPLVDRINQLLDRCRHLVLYDLTSLEFSRFSQIQGQSILQNLSVRATEISSALCLGPLAAPKRLITSFVRLKLLDISWKSLTELRSSNFDLDEILQILTLAPQMTSFRQYGIVRPTSFSSDKYRTILHPHLVTLGLASAHTDLIEIFFQNTTFPKLTICDLEFSGAFPLATFMKFLTRSSCPITNLCISEVRISSEDLIKIARVLPSITRLTLSHFESDELNIYPPFDDFYSALCQDPRYRSVLPDDVALLPSLHWVLIMTLHPFPWGWLPGLYHRYRADGSVYATLPSRPHLKHINIYCYQTADYDARSSSFIDTWETFSELMELMESVALKLHIEDAQGGMPDLFTASYRHLHSAVGTAPQDIQESYERLIAKRS